MRRAVSKRRDPLGRCRAVARPSPPTNLKPKTAESNQAPEEEERTNRKQTSDDMDRRDGVREELPQTPIHAILTGSNCCEALGITARGRAPILDLCRALVAAGYDPGRPLHAYRGDVLALKVRSIGEGAQLTVREDRAGPRFVAWEPFPRGVKSRASAKTEGVGHCPRQG
jgi:hypothetical protein